MKYITDNVKSRSNCSGFQTVEKLGLPQVEIFKNIFVGDGVLDVPHCRDGGLDGPQNILVFTLSPLPTP